MNINPGLILVIAIAAPAAAGAQSGALQEADEHFQAERWAEAATVYERVLEADSTTAMAWYRLGRVRHAQERDRDALRLFEAAARHGFPPVYVGFARVRSLVALGETGLALDQLEGLADDGFGSAGAITGDPGLSALLDHPRMASILARVERNAAPCEHEPAFRELDFWVGEWVVVEPRSGRKLGDNRVERHVAGCMLLENWTAAGGGTGKSMNIYDRSRDTWRQLWISSTGNVLDYSEGELRDSAMHFRGASLDERGDTILQRLVFEAVAPDTVRQVFTQSTDGGANWQTTFVGLYVRTEQPD